MGLSQERELEIELELVYDELRDALNELGEPFELVQASIWDRVGEEIARARG